MFFLAFVTLGLEVAGYDVKVQASALFVIFGMWMFSLLGVLQQLADMQARLDMKRIARGELPE